VDGIDTVAGHFHLTNHQSEMECMDMVDEHFHPMNHRSKVEDMNTVDTGMGDRAAELKVVEREPKGVVLVRHWTDDGAMRHRRIRRVWEELVKLRCSKDQPTFATHDYSCSLP
jgi:hypothetical protein